MAPKAPSSNNKRTGTSRNGDIPNKSAQGNVLSSASTWAIGLIISNLSLAVILSVLWGMYSTYLKPAFAKHVVEIITDEANFRDNQEADGKSKPKLLDVYVNKVVDEFLSVERMSEATRKHVRTMVQQTIKDELEMLNHVHVNYRLADSVQLQRFSVDATKPPTPPNLDQLPAEDDDAQPCGSPNEASQTRAVSEPASRSGKTVCNQPFTIFVLKGQKVELVSPRLSVDFYREIRGGNIKKKVTGLDPLVDKVNFEIVIGYESAVISNVRNEGDINGFDLSSLIKFSPDEKLKEVLVEIKPAPADPSRTRYTVEGTLGIIVSNAAVITTLPAEKRAQQ